VEDPLGVVALLEAGYELNGICIDPWFDSKIAIKPIDAMSHFSSGSGRVSMTAELQGAETYLLSMPRQLCI
jgi:hypothetical protein